MTSSPSSGPGRRAAARERPRARLSRAQLSAVIMLLLCQFLIILDTTGFNVAVTAIARNFEVPASQASVINLGFVITVAMMIPLSGWLGERFGTVRIIVVSLGLMMLGSLVCAGGVSLQMVIAGRIVQGLGGGGLVPLAASLMYRNFEPLHRLRVMTFLSMPISLAPALGPLIGGFFVSELSWRWAFMLNVPICTAALIVGLFFASEVTTRTVRPLDVRGAALTIVGFGAVVLGLERLTVAGQLGAGVVSLAIGVVALALLIPHEHRIGARAFLDINLFRHRTFAKTTSIIAVHSIGFMGFGLAGPLLLQTQLGLTAFEAGLISAANAVGPFVASRFARPLIARLKPRAAAASSQTSILVGLVVVTGGYALHSLPLICVGMFVFGMGTFVTVLTCQTVGFAVVPNANLGDATAIEGTSRQIGGAIGITAVSGALAAATALDARMLGTVLLVLGTLALFHVTALAIIAGPGRLPLPAAREAAAPTPQRAAEA